MSKVIEKSEKGQNKKSTKPVCWNSAVFATNQPFFYQNCNSDHLLNDYIPFNSLWMDLMYYLNWWVKQTPPFML